jgi:uncharacterized protein YjbI with pentapeptide repeats
MARSTEQHDGSRRLGWAGWTLLCLAAATLLLGLVVYVPRWLYPPLDAVALPTVAPDRRIELETDRLRLQSDARAGLIQALAGLAVLTGAFVGWRQLRHTIEATLVQHELDRSGQITERFTRAIDQLGNQGQLEVILGGIYGLERIARDSASDRATVAEVLVAYVHTHAPWPPATSNPYGPSVPVDTLPTLQERAPDVQAAVTVLGRGSFSEATMTGLDLHQVDLRKAMLTGADFRRMILSGAHLEGARLARARLEDAELEGAHLQGAFLYGAQLQRASLDGAQLEGAVLDAAQLQRATLDGAQLQDAYLSEAQMQGASLDSVQMQGADLSQAQLQGAFLTEAQLQRTRLASAGFQEADLGGANLKEARLTSEGGRHPANFREVQASHKTVWPDGFDPKAAGVRYYEETEAEMPPD